MADVERNRRDFTRRAGSGAPNPGGEYVLVGSRFVQRGENRVLIVHHRGDKVTLDDEQAARLQAGKPGSPFQREQDVVEPETVEVAVANEATYPAEEDGFKAGPDGRTNRRVPATRAPEAGEAAGKVTERQNGIVPDPVTTTETTAPAKTSPKR